jgi:hypothetical protein
MPSDAAARRTAVSEALSKIDAAFTGIVTGVETVDESQTARPGQDSLERFSWLKVKITPLKIAKQPALNPSEIWIPQGTSCSHGALPLTYVEVLAYETDGRLVAYNPECRCKEKLVFAFDGPLPPWIGIGMSVTALAIIAGIVLGIRRLFHFRKKETS